MQREEKLQRSAVSVLLLKKWKLWETALLLALCVSLLTGLWAQREQRELSDSLIRLHVLAVSDEAEEQALKLRVRDAVLAFVSPLLSESGNADEAEALLRAALPELQRAAEAVSEGRTVSVGLGREHYPTRDYAGFSLPAGDYRSLRVTLGEGKGHNWWCVVFPPLCTAESLEPQAVETMTKDDARLITSDETDVVIKFRILEWYDAIKEALT